MASRWYIYPIAGSALVLGAGWLTRRAAPMALIREWLGEAPAGPENYVHIVIPFTVRDMSVESARAVANSLKPRSISPVFDPPGLDFHFNPITLPTKFIEFRWQPPAYRHELIGRPGVTGAPVKPSKSSIRRLAQTAYRTFYQSKMEKLVDGGWRITLIGEVPL